MTAASVLMLGSGRPRRSRQASQTPPYQVQVHHDAVATSSPARAVGRGPPGCAVGGIHNEEGNIGHDRFHRTGGSGAIGLAALPRDIASSRRLRATTAVDRDRGPPIRGTRRHLTAGPDHRRSESLCAVWHLGTLTAEDRSGVPSDRPSTGTSFWHGATPFKECLQLPAGIEPAPFRV